MTGLKEWSRVRMSTFVSRLESVKDVALCTAESRKRMDENCMLGTKHKTKERMNGRAREYGTSAMVGFALFIPNPRLDYWCFSLILVCRLAWLA